MRSRQAGGEDVYNPVSDRVYNEYKLAVIANIIGHDPAAIESLRIDYAAVNCARCGHTQVIFVVLFSTPTIHQINCQFF